MRKPSAPQIADYIIRYAKIADPDGPPFVACRGALWRYSQSAGVWESIEEREAMNWIIRCDGATVAPDTSPMFCGGGKWIQDVLKVLSVRVYDPLFFDDPAPVVALTNTAIHVSERGVELVPHSKDHKARFNVGAPWDPDAKAPRWQAALVDWLGDDAEGRACSELLAEFVGAALMGCAWRYGKALFLLGEGNNGKSCFLDVIRRLFPKDAVSATPIHSFGYQYSRAALTRVAINIVEELPGLDVEDMATLKSMVTGGVIEARDPFDRPFAAHARCAHVFAANDLPRIKDSSHGAWRRLAVIPFNRSIADPIRSFADQIAEHELTGVLAWAVHGAVRLQRNGSYTAPECVDHAVRQWRVESDPVASWAEDCVVHRPEADAPLSNLYTSFEWWCTESGIHRYVSRVEFGRRLNRLGYTAKRSNGATSYPLVLKVK